MLASAFTLIEGHERMLIEDALAAVSASLTGGYHPSQHFADLDKHIDWSDKP